MNNTMQLDVATTPSGNRKRTVQQREAENEDEENPSIDQWDDTPSKRLRDRQGVAVGRRMLKYNTQTLLNHLAFTQLYVTANFPRYNPSSSPVILVFVTAPGRFYRVLSQILPSLYQAAPALQALAISPMPLSRPDFATPADVQALPVKAMNDMDDNVACDLECLRQALHDPNDAIAVFDAMCTCVWTSSELDFQESTTSESVLCEEMANAIARTIQSTSQEDSMDFG